MTDQKTITLIKKLRSETGAPLLEIKKAIETHKGDLEKITKQLKAVSSQKADSKKDENTASGLVEAYIHAGGKVGAMIVLSCQTDFVAKTKEFKNLAHELVLQVASMKPSDITALLKQNYVRNPKLKISDLLNEHIGKFGENIKIKNISRFEI